MSYVSEVSSDEAPTVLIVDNNQMSIMRLREVFKKRGFATQVCEDGDLAVDEYIKLDPELVVMSLDIPSLDGHLAALEMREHGGDSRILFIAPNRLRELAVHATYSAGAVGWLEDLDDLYPEDRIKPQPDEPQLPPITELPPLEALPPLAELPAVEPAASNAPPAKKKGKKLLLLLLLVGLGAGLAYQQGYLDSLL